MAQEFLVLLESFHSGPTDHVGNAALEASLLISWAFRFVIERIEAVGTTVLDREHVSIDDYPAVFHLCTWACCQQVDAFAFI